MSELQQQKFDNITEQYSELADQIEHTTNMIETELDIVSAKGRFAGEGYFLNLISEEQKRLDLLQEEYATLIEERDKAVASGNIAKYSEAW